MRSERIFNSMNWRYAIGEVLLIVIGVSIALAANSWYELRQAREDQVEILAQIRTALVADLESIEDRLNDYRMFSNDADSLVRKLEQGSPVNEETIRQFGTLNGFRTIRISTAPFENLKSRGLDLISDPALRTRLISLYQGELANVQKNMDIDMGFVRERITPYFLQAFVRDSENRWRPKAYQEIVDDSYVANVARYRAFTLDTFAIPSIVRSQKLMQQILSEIDEELRALTGWPVE